MYITLEKKRLVFGCFLESKENVAKSQCNRFDGGVLKNLKLISISRFHSLIYSRSKETISTPKQ